MGKNRMILKDIIKESLPDMYISYIKETYAAYVEDVKIGAKGFVHIFKTDKFHPMEVTEISEDKVKGFRYCVPLYDETKKLVNVYLRKRDEKIEEQPTFPYIPYNEKDPFFEGVPKDLYYRYIESETESSLNLAKTTKGRYAKNTKRTIFSLFSLNTPESKGIKRILDKNINNIRFVGNGIVWPLLAVKVYISERTESVEIIIPDKRKDKTLKNMSKVQLLEWAFDNCKFVPIKIKQEDFYDENISHKWSHIKSDKETMAKLAEYLGKVDFKPSFDTYYFIKQKKDKKGKMIYYLKRDTKMSPLK